MRFRNSLRAAAGLQGASGPTNLKALTGMAAFLFIFATLLPAEVYQYTGMDYTTVSGSTYTSSESVSATFTFADPLAASMTGIAPTAISWSVNDGVNTLSDSTSGSLVILLFSTDSMSNITDWYFYATNYSSASMGSGGPSAESTGTPNSDFVQAGADGGISTTAGSWQDTTPTPEPGTLGTMLAGLLLLFVTMRCRANKPIV